MKGGKQTNEIHTRHEHVLIYMPLNGEGVDVMRPVAAERTDGDRYRILGPMPEHEEWAFPHGSIVCGCSEQRDGQTLLVANA